MAVTSFPIALAILTPICPRPPMPTMPTLFPPPRQAKSLSGVYIVMPEQKSGPAEDSGKPEGIWREKKRKLIF